MPFSAGIFYAVLAIIIACIFFSTCKVVIKFFRLGYDVRERLKTLKLAMTVVRNFSNNELRAISHLSDDDFNFFNSIEDKKTLIGSIKERLEKKECPTAG
jgi:hypothetical protein